MSRKKKTTFSEAITKAKLRFGGKYSYEDFRFTDMTTKSSITCKVHGNFEMTLWNHAILGQECPKCKGRNLTTSDVIVMFNEKHGDKYDYNKFKYLKMHSKSIMICEEHGEFLQTPSKHLLGQGCPKCKSIENGKSMRLKDQVIIERAMSVHGGKYSYDKFKYNGMHSQSIITCKIHGDFNQIVEDHLNCHGCPKCSRQVSRAEDEILSHITKNIDNEKSVKTRDRSILRGKEIDILIPSNGIGVEYNGDRWHSDKFKDKDYHIGKKSLSSLNGVDLVLVNESEYKLHKDVILDILSSLINEDINDGLLEKMISVKLMKIDNDKITIDNRYSTKSLLKYIENRYKVDSFNITKPYLVSQQCSKYKYWNCGFLTYKL